jgi:hypothetical protein
MTIEDTDACECLYIVDHCLLSLLCCGLGPTLLSWATKPTPQASLSFAGSNRPLAGGIAECASVLMSLSVLCSEKRA